MVFLRSSVMCGFLLASLALSATAASIATSTRPAAIKPPPSVPRPALLATVIPLDDGGFRRGAGITAFTDDGRMDICVAAQCLVQNATIKTGLNGYTPANEFSNRKVQRQTGKYSFEGSLPGSNVRFFMEAVPWGDSVQITIRRDGQWPASAGWCAFQVPLPQDIYAGTKCLADGKEVDLPAAKPANTHLISAAKTVSFLPGNDQAGIEIASPVGISVYDARQWDSPMYQVGIDFPLMNPSTVSLTIRFPEGTANQKKPRLCLSTVGYSSLGLKEVAMEWIKGTTRPADGVKVLDSAGNTVASGQFGPTLTHKHLQNEYASFDFSGVKTPGKYSLVWDAGQPRDIEIKQTIFQESLWAPTLDVFIPWQMCHAKVTYANGKLPDLRACHMDDGQRVPANFPGIDGFRSYEADLTPFKEGDMIPCGIGGWHDAGDYDLNVHAQGHTTWKLALTYEEFAVDRDNMTMDIAAQSVICGKPDGVPDILQQVQWGARWLLTMQQNDGLVYPGVCCRPGGQYTANVLPAKLSDGVPGTKDERYVYVDYQPDSQLAQVVSLAAAGRVLNKIDPALAKQCISAAEQAYAYYRAAPDICRPNIYFDKKPEDGRTGAAAAALAELYLTTRKGSYLGDLEKIGPDLAKQKVTWPAAYATGTGGWWYAPSVLARLAPHLQSGTLKAAIIELCRRAEVEHLSQSSARPFPFQWFHLLDWGPAGHALNRTFDAYYLQKVTSGKFNVAGTQREMFWMLGYHPLSDVVFVCDVGAPSPKYLYNGRLHGRYRLAASSVPGAVVPSMGGVQGAGMAIYNDVHGNYFHNEACIYSAADYLFAVHALKAAGY